MDNSTITKMQLHYWEAKQTFLKKVKRKQDDFVVSSDAELDAKLELLKSIDETNQNLLNFLDLYQDRVCAVAQEECIIGRFLRECSKVDSTKAGHLMSGSGKTLLFASHQFISLRNILIRLYRDVQTFQYRAVADTFDTVEQMEKVRNTYRAALLWMKDVSKQLDPDAYNQMGKFKKVQEHVRKTKQVFDKLKIDCIQKIDLLSASRCNLFSNVLVGYQNTLQDIWGKTSKTMNIFVDTFKSHQSYEFTMLKELNDQSSEDALATFESRLKEIFAQENINEKDMLVFFESEYTDDKRSDRQDSRVKSNSNDSRPNTKDSNHANANKKSTNQKSATKRDIKHNKMETNNKVDPLLNLDFETIENDNNNSEKEQAKPNLLNELYAPNHFMPSSLIDFRHRQNMQNPDLIENTDFNKFVDMSSQQQSSQQLQKPSKSQGDKPASKKTERENTLESWLNLFSDIDPLSNPDEFEKKISSDKENVERNC